MSARLPRTLLMVATTLLGGVAVVIGSAAFGTVYAPRKMPVGAHAHLVALLLGVAPDPAAEDLARFLAAPLGGSLVALCILVTSVISHAGGRARWAAPAMAAAFLAAAIVPLPVVGAAPVVILLFVAAALALLSRGDVRPPAAAPRARFWDRWLVVVCVGGTLLGLGLPILVETSLFAPWRDGVAKHFLRFTSFAEVQGTWRGLVAAIGGALAGTLLLCTMLAVGPFRRREAWARDAILGSIAAWIIFDSIGSVWRGAWFHLYLVNLPFAALLLAPLLATRAQFSVERAASSLEPMGISSSDGSDR